VIGARDDEPPALEFAVEEVRPRRREPALALSLRIDAAGRSPSGLSLTVRIQIRPELRRYSAEEAGGLWELFGPVEHWGRSLAPVPWAKLRHDVGPFTGAATTEFHLPCTFDDGAAAPKYLAALEVGVVPLELLFTGTLSWLAQDGRPQTAMIPWDRDATFRMPLEVWRELESRQ
jgi:Family of unknown function (DUF6084)